MQIKMNPAQRIMAVLIGNCPNTVSLDEVTKLAQVERNDARRWLNQLIMDGVVITDVIGKRVAGGLIARERVYQPAESCAALAQLIGLS